MPEWLLFLVVACLVVCGGSVAVVLGILHVLAVRNRVVPGQRSPAPLTWLVSPDGAARLHRRLRNAMAAAGAVAGVPADDDLGLHGVITELQTRALQLDHQLVLASRCPRAARRRMLRELHSEISEVENLVQRTVRMSRAWTGSTPSERGLGPVRERLELLESALRELDGIDLTARPAPAPLPPSRRQA